MERSVQNVAQVDTVHKTTNEESRISGERGQIVK